MAVLSFILNDIEWRDILLLLMFGWLLYRDWDMWKLTQRVKILEESPNGK